jgi:FHS family L-fucose permease-like MFS transporter
MALATSQSKISVEEQKGSYLFPLILVTSLFFLWGLAYGLLDVLNKHFQELLSITKTRSTLLQAAYFGAYFLIALPAGLFMNKYGYKKGIITGLLLYTTGALLFFPSAQFESYNFFLLSLFILASGLTFLETAANPYITVLGKPESSEFRLNLSQSFNGVGSFIGPIIGANLFFAAGDAGNLNTVKYVYLVIASVVFIIALLFIRTPLPEIKEEKLVSDVKQDIKPLFSHKNFVGAIITQFFYVAAQVGIAALFINYCTEASSSITNAQAAKFLSISLFLFTIGRFAGTALMKKIAPNKLLTIYSIINIILLTVIVYGKGMISVYSLMAVFFFESIMFPTIFALGVKNLGHNTKRGGSFIIMSIAGGAFMPYVMGMLSEKTTAHAYIVPLLCFIIVAWYGWKGYKATDV